MSAQSKDSHVANVLRGAIVLACWVCACGQWDPPLDVPGEDFARPGLNGPHTDYYEGGQPYFESEYRDGWKHGVETRRWESGAIMHRGSFVMGKQDGEWQYFYSNGQLMSQITFRDDEPFGPRTFWSDSGKVETKLEARTRDDGSKYLVMFGWHSNGNRSVEGELKDEVGLVRRGIWRLWNEDGSRDTQESGMYGRNQFKRTRALTEEEWTKPI